MEARQRLVVPARAGLLLIVMGFLAFVGSYFLLPVVGFTCFDCDHPATYFTAWKVSIRALTLLPTAPAPAPFIMDALILLLCYLPLVAAVTVLGSTIGLLVHPQWTGAIWNHRAWLVGISALGIALPLLFIPFVHSDTGYFGMLFGYSLFWGGNHLLTAHP